LKAKRPRGRPPKERPYRVTNIRCTAPYSSDWKPIRTAAQIAAAYRDIARRYPPHVAEVTAWLRAAADSLESHQLERTGECALSAILNLEYFIRDVLMPRVAEGLANRTWRENISKASRGKKRNRDS
jgi:hypothetical protein